MQDSIVADPVHHVEVFRDDVTKLYGYQCFTCGFTQRNVTDLPTAQEHADEHPDSCRCEVH